MRLSWLLAPLVLSPLLLGASAASSNSETPAVCSIPAGALAADTRIVRGTLVRAGESAAGTPSRTTFCRFEGVIEAEIGFELWLPPREAWNGRFLGAGVGGQAGSIATNELMRGVGRGYAAASTDTGHKASDARWLLNRPDRAVNYAERANHLLAVRMKGIVAAYYGKPPRNSFFMGCSGGGRQAMTQLQRFPDDYDGIIAGAPGVNTPEMSARRLWEMIQHENNKGVLNADQWKFIADAAVAQCDGDDGLKDGILTDPRRCGFRIESLACTAASAGKPCLTPQQVKVARLIYSPLKDEAGRKIDDGIVPGIPISPVGLPQPSSPGPRYLATVLFGDGVYGDPNWDPRTFSIQRDLPAIDRLMNLHADNPAVDRFAARGGKLILYHGWADALVSALPTIDYWHALEARFGKAGTRRFARLFLVPGMDHCRGGNVPDRFGGLGGDGDRLDPGHDMLSALEHWADGGPAPERIVAVQRDGPAMGRSRPLCAFPTEPRYRGGPADSAASFACTVARNTR